MAIEVIPYTDQWVGAVMAFNERMRAGGSWWGWYASPVDLWLPERDGRKTWREHWLAVEDGKEVRGAFALKPHEWRIRGEPHQIVDWQGPVTEGAVDRRYNTLGLRLMREMLRRHPLLYSWGHGGAEQPLLQMLEKLGWRFHPTPFCLRVLRPARFLRRNRYLRTSAARRAALDALAFSGAGSIALPALHAALALRRRRSPPARASEIERFDAWADELWERVRADYQAIACRDAATMNALCPSGRWPHGIKLRVEREGATLGWAVVLDTRMEDDVRFGTLRVGSVVDCLAAPADAESVVGAAFRFLRERGVDLVVSNQAHPAWVEAFAAHGFVALAGRRLFAISPELQKLLMPLEATARGLHLTNMDGHGPMSL